MDTNEIKSWYIREKVMELVKKYWWIPVMGIAIFLGWKALKKSKSGVPTLG